MATADKDLAKLSVQLELQTAAFEAGVKRMDGQLKRMEKNTKRSSKGFDKLNKTLAKVGISFGALVGALSVRELANATREAIAFGDAIAKTASKVGVSVEELQELRFAAKQSGVDIRQLDMGIQRFARRMGEAAQGTGELLKTTQALGIEFKNADGTNKSTVELLEQYAKAIGRAETQQEKLRLAFKAFDSEGAALVNLLADGGEEMEALREQARELGLVMSENLTTIATELNDEIGILSESLKNNLYSALIKVSYGFLKAFGFSGSTEANIAYYKQQIADLNEEMQEFLSDGNVFLARDRAAKIGKVAEKLNPLLAKWRELNEVIDETPEPTGPSDEVIAKYKKLIEAVALLEDPLKKYKDRIAEINQAFIDGALSFEQAAGLIKDIGLEAYYATDPMGKFQKQVEDTVKSFDSFEGKSAKLAVLNEALRRFEEIGDSVSADNVWAEILKVEGFDEAEDAVTNYAGVAEEALKKIQDAADGFISDFTSELVDGLAEGELAFDDFAKSVLKTIAKIVLNEIFTQFFTAVSGNLFPKAAEATLPETVTASIAQGQSGMTRAGEQATAMTVGRLVSNQSASGGNTSPVTVNVNNYGKDEVAVTERRDSNGGIEIDVLIKNTVKNGFAGGDFDKVMSSTFGARRLGY